MNKTFRRLIAGTIVVSSTALGLAAAGKLNDYDKRYYIPNAYSQQMGNDPNRWHAYRNEHHLWDYNTNEAEGYFAGGFAGLVLGGLATGQFLLGTEEKQKRKEQ